MDPNPKAPTEVIRPSGPYGAGGYPTKIWRLVMVFNLELPGLAGQYGHGYLVDLDFLVRI